MPSPGPITIDALPSAGTLTFQTMTGFEALGIPFEYRIDVLSTKADMGASDVIGSAVSVALELKAFQMRYFNGIVAAFEYRGFEGPLAKIRLFVRPWFWFLTQAKNSRIFQNMSIVDVIKEVFDKYDLTGVVDYTNLQQSYPPREYVVQYAETDFNFVSRLLENEGIYYFFRHEQGEHQMILVDTYTTHVPVPDYDKLPFAGPDTHRDALQTYVWDWNIVEQVQPGAYFQRDFDFTNPVAPLESPFGASKGYDLDDFEVYEYPGGFLTTTEGEGYSRVRLQELQTRFTQASGASNARGLSVGSTFHLINHPRDDQNADYLVISAEYVLRGHDTKSNVQTEEEPFACTFVAMDPTTPFRPAKTAAKAVVRGPQTAIVVGPEGKEIWVDEYGRVQVQFHWDRQGVNNEKSSCPVRVSQVWAGSGWGAVFTPRIGQEVIVDFLEGDPDQPIITGRVHNGSNMPPYKPKTHPTQSGIRSHSSPKGSQANFNEIRFEDLKGSEELYIQAERAQTTVVKGSQSISVGGDRSVTVTRDETYTVKKNRTTDITEKETLKVHGDVLCLFDKMYDTAVGDAASVTVKNDYFLSTTSGQITLTHGKSEFNITQGEEAWVDTANAHIMLQPGGNIEAGNNSAMFTMDSGGAIQLSATAATITIKRGDTTIVVTDDKISITAASMVEVKAPTVNITADEKVHAAVGGSSMDLTPDGVTVAGTMIKLNS
jgi:type VI secretion system secreted protein VgrG